MKRKRNPEAANELFRLRQNAPALISAGMTGPAILAAWFLFGDDMWVKHETALEPSKQEAQTNAKS